ncbi:hypothetical protein [Agrobacterium genomosp. 13]|uniref:Uncharacterized protein n=1 Tax=Agrobacterium genomosp. 13 str. CFBP 6927 TaxID=1183428 RepID=A0ABM9VNX5_9HYPH|nr:hypothetical protein [Agrobacterium genomosp. 13]CUX66630.1 hypothetical protein AGR13a_Lc90459 [Agrobacterium genomosp. 13 str. CFBP 6927]
MNSLPIRDYLADCMATAGLSQDDLQGPSGSPERLIRLVLEGTAKMPLEKVSDVAALLKCDDRALFRVALTQFYSAGTVALLERMLGPQERSAGEDAWVSFVRSVAPDDVQPPDSFARNMLRSLLNRTK